MGSTEKNASGLREGRCFYTMENPVPERRVLCSFQREQLRKELGEVGELVDWVGVP